MSSGCHCAICVSGKCWKVIRPIPGHDAGTAKIHNLIWRPLLIGKFGPYYRDANMAWLWARLHVRSFKLGTFVGGFQTFIDRLTAAVAQHGGVIHLATPVTGIEPQADGQIHIEAGQHSATFDQVLHTTSPALSPNSRRRFSADYLSNLLQLKHMGAVVLTFALRHPLLEDGTYWLNLPAETPDKISKPTSRFSPSSNIPTTLIHPILAVITLSIVATMCFLTISSCPCPRTKSKPCLRRLCHDSTQSSIRPGYVKLAVPRNVCAASS